MASSALIRGARDIARANIVDPYKFSAWIRSMWYGLDKIDDRRYNLRMAQISSAAKIQGNNMKILQDQNKQDIKGMEGYLGKVSDLTGGMYTQDKASTNPTMKFIHGSFTNFNAVKRNTNPNSLEFQDATLGQNEIMEGVGTMSTLYKNFRGEMDQVYEATSNDDMSKAMLDKNPVYMSLMNPNKRTLHFITNEEGQSDMAFIFNNPNEDIKRFLPKLLDADGNPSKDQDGNIMYGITWSNYLTNYSDWYLKNKGKEGEINAAYDELVALTSKGKAESTKGKRNPIFQHDGGELRISTEEEFTAAYPFDISLTQPRTLQDGSQINKNKQTNLQAVAYDYDIDGIGGAPTFADSFEAMAIQPMYLQWLKDEKGMSDEMAETAPMWILDEDFAFGHLTIDDVYDEPFEGENLLQHAMNIHYGKAAFEALKPIAQTYMSKKAAEDKAKQIKAAKGSGKGDIDKKALALQELKTKYNNQFNQLKPLFSYGNNYGVQDSEYNFVSDPKSRDKLFKELMPTNTASGKPIEIRELIKNGARVPGGYSIWVEGVQNNVRDLYPKGEFNVTEPQSMKILWKYLFDDDTYGGVWPTEWKEFAKAQERPRAGK